MSKSETYNMDCLEYMKSCKDQQFSLLFTDPPYGNDACYNTHNPSYYGSMFEKYHYSRKRPKAGQAQGGKSSHSFYKYGKDECAEWNMAPPHEWWNEAWRIAEHIACWGGNYFELPPSRGFIIWLKPNPENFSLAQMEYCWTSIPMNSRIVKAIPQDKERFHPTQKPLPTFAKPLEWFKKHINSEKCIIDPFMGSGTSRIAAWDAGINYVGIEANEIYFQKQEERFKEHIARGNIYEGIKTEEGDDLFD